MYLSLFIQFPKHQLLITEAQNMLPVICSDSPNSSVPTFEVDAVEIIECT